MSRDDSKFPNGGGLLYNCLSTLSYNISCSLPNKFIMLVSTTDAIIIIPFAYVIPSSCQRIRHQHLRAVVPRLFQDCLDLPTSSVLRREPALPLGLQYLFLDAVHNPHGHEQVMSICPQLLPRALQTMCRSACCHCCVRGAGP